ncbi:tyrosine-type recombinase/integrase [Mesorhizobium captivum]|uniref:tyrosine-type recombinase/integrase n=1 Tax=Mesorhizobium captivum TaxID=3072319 RepID=UPI002A24C9F2|nr:tyrosine-type recombinase/integrase [Mesorhizobium sp. VK22E]MDX8509244.1 tyrosine-type recombinase/integrase [Mesorhizobium sp. VK22E]
MLDAIETYLALRRTTGFAMSTAEYLLKSFAAFAAERGQTYVETKTAIDWAALIRRATRCTAQSRLSLRTPCSGGGRQARAAAGKSLRRPEEASHAAHLHDRRDQSAGRSCAAASANARLALAHASDLDRAASTGLRISEALKLTIADVTRDGLLIRETKFRKTRLVPLHDTAVAGLQRYLARRGPGPDDDPVFIDKHGWPLRYIAVKETFDRLVDKAGIGSTSARRPRLHDLRHTFAVRALQGSPTGRGRCGAHMAALATYMGHVNIYATYWYLEATPDLLRDVAMAGEAFMSEGRSA